MKAFYKYSPIPTYIWQRVEEDFVLVDYNDAVVEITKGKIADLLDKKATEIYWDVPEILDGFKRCYTEKSSLQREMFYRMRTTGEYKYLAVKYAFMPPDLILVHTDDITERKKIEERLAKINKCLLSLGNNTEENINRLVALCGKLMGAIWAQYNRLDKGMLSLIGKWNIPQDFINLNKPEGHICYDVIRKGDNQSVVLRNLQQSRYAESDPNVVKYNLHTIIGIAVKCCEKYVGSLCVVYQQDFEPGETDLEIMGIIASAIETQENYKVAKDKLKESVELYQILYEENPSMYFTVNEQGIVLSVNNFGAEQLGYSVDELIGKSVLVIFHDKDKKAVRRQLNTCIQNPGQVMNWEFRKLRKDGTVIWVKEAARAIVDANSNKKVLIVCEDISERIKAQHEKTKILKKLAETEKLGILGQLTAAIAHEINNPLDIIQTKLYLLQKKLIKDYQNQEIWDHIVKIKQQIYRLDRLIKDILNYAKPPIINLQTVQVNQILKKTIELISDYFTENISLETDYEPDLPAIQGDELGLEIVFNNLILNSLESIQRKGKIKVMTRLLNQEMIEIKIEDNGEGIAENDLQNIFNPFFTSKSRTGGTGLGLTLCKDIIDQHKGKITVESKPEVGTTVKVYLYIYPEFKKF